MIGVFDSGYGGLTVFKPLAEKFPKYDFIYFGDNARTPYGSREPQEIYEFTRQAVDWLFKNGCELIILACNTASSQALRKIQHALPDKKVLGVLIPIAKKVATLEGTIGILATQATVESGAYLRELKKYGHPMSKIFQVAAPKLVPLIEAGMIYHSAMKEALRRYLDPFKKQNIKNIILGCTHYPLIKNIIQSEMPDAQIFDSPSVIPVSLENYLSRHLEIKKRIGSNGLRRYITTGDPEKFSKFAKDLLNIKIAPEKIIL
ncbi:glutamate racemase [Candidatus Giovannonibacteria bacterium RIFCSPLOWO2_02_FULL_43_11b]|uniref:Glutamate racemase n=1 Tax=Candidatus Giovannonibacteria bacterium RIFCSPHIGHO2_12_FULL_43_15 TaxID=1798341 RepID=A0A1F5WR51_9BACT|nr:MAG: glutamate racemase [Candidatus Giovannonibacteria bacterium RIFCSPHIGHO2_01_FULL_43_100]OGF66918.1 MAG: glutamate racemase [Candidatus Giovannonibacteria bacterium RIFCSPHIGHO2_02_FULL_43_32]OGF78100.1 MAG: glutamate racemase [Candidatus Giovannonibacteria bacterium RIFCSPHIGHO2_12_FULL_43_15]OGF78507.1 MAG: glutamate racemase [Candidatus Giovannonibacteria bacterium RIFCSPLOWO2_01_FULL_43_60]OGF89167.1 MAG: glutamate racemase [Candidatus Giovannonibacteria bacterium RIFCSPLOWO2_02_FULL